MPNPGEARRRLRSRLVGVVLVAASSVLAAGERADNRPPIANATCPVKTGEPISADQFVEFQGRRVFFCCENCRGKFQRDPEAYVARLAALGAPEATEPANAEAAAPAASVGGLAAWARLAGRLHILVLHFPIALLLAAAAAEVFRLRRDRRPGDAAYACLVLGAAAAVAAAGAGWLLAAGEPPEASLAGELFIHRWCGVGAAGLAVLTALVATVGRRSESAVLAQVYRVGVVACAVLVAIVGHFGGRMVYGPNYLMGVLSPKAVTPRTVARDLPEKAPEPAASNDALFAADHLEQLLARRAARLALLPLAPAPPKVNGPAFNDIDRFVVAAWEGQGLASESAGAPEVCDDATYQRRVYLDVIGVVPTLEEQYRFMGSHFADKRARLVDELLARDDDYAAHWTPFWEDALGSVSTGGTQGGVASHGNYRDWIYKNFRDNTPYDVMVASLIDPGMPGHQADVMADVNGKVTQVAYILNSDHKLTLQSAANVGQVFLGTGMKCASCHNHFENKEWPQTRFLGFAGLFSGHDLEQIRCEKPLGNVIAASFPFEIPGAPVKAPAELSGRLARAAQLITDPADPRFAKTIVNRLWKRYLGLGLFEPADDYREGRAAGHEELLAWLADDFMRSGYDLKHTIRLILNSRTYQLRYDAALEDHFDVTKPERARVFRSPALRRLTAEQIIDSVRVVMTQKLDAGRRVYLDKTSTALTRALGKPASRNEISTSRPDDAAVVQSLELLNGDDFHALVYGGGALVKEALSAGSVDSGDVGDGVTMRVFPAVLGRAPTAEERKVAGGFVGDATPGVGGAPTEVVFIDDEVPAGGMPGGTKGPESWNWNGAPARPVFSGQRAAAIADTSGEKAQMFVLKAASPMIVGADDTLFAYVYLDPASPPKEIMLQWNDGDGGSDGGWAHRAYWGEDVIPYGMAGTPSRVRMGELPKTGGWVRLEVAADVVGLGGSANRVSGMSFDQAGGSPAFWDKAGVMNQPADPRREPVGDLLWALFTSPEFQYIR